MSKRVRIFAVEDVELHKDRASCWVTRHGKVYDVTEFLPDHPGGDDLILKYGGKDVDEVMRDASEHEHSESAFDMLGEYFIGRIGSGEATVSDADWVADENFHPEETDTTADYERSQFLDLRKPLLKQVWYANWSKHYYLQQVHQPRHLSEPARLFGPGYLEVFTRTKWFVVPLFWGPIAGYLFVRSLLQWTTPLPLFSTNPWLPVHLLSSIGTDSIAKTTLCFFAGNIIWTLLEYTLHRFLFHIDELLPDTPAFLTLHFLLHGIHHYLPMDRLRLVMPPTLFAILQAPFTRLAHILFPPAMANGIIAGSFTFYVLYDCMHYALHHTQLPQYMREMKKYHLAHHYKNFELGFGVTSKIWDVVFNTVLPV
ncbi:oxidoreductase [Punctularia strigosozonata HHB-11173 SS5]|uniref:oxidoreductase n=1 Tax=Punctularia strigosozonata (strain HHB-11173) TaxID=741275 RepID=UPI00044170F8|nr:oxidoreductase [Punctularia strigosozonata HHB-11173 SS5]EIN08846.1 oxidoreductase [Punctularia strigosozonata HHB-11173 SS5]